MLGNKFPFLDGDEVTFSCDNNHDLFGKARLRCVGKKWDSSVLECKGRFFFLESSLLTVTVKFGIHYIIAYTLTLRNVISRPNLKANVKAHIVFVLDLAHMNLLFRE